METLGKLFALQFVTASEQTRFERLRIRRRLGDNITIENFQGRDLQQKRMGLDRINRSGSVHILNNDDKLAAYLDRVDSIVGQYTGNEIDIGASIESLQNVTKIGLGDSILISLLSVWQEDETREFYTTTEIASLISKVFLSIQPKHKDNVSRYFNQDFYAYYEIYSVEISAPRQYRLSNTGYGMAMLTLRRILSLRE